MHREKEGLALKMKIKHTQKQSIKEFVERGRARNWRCLLHLHSNWRQRKKC